MSKSDCLSGYLMLRISAEEPKLLLLLLQLVVLLLLVMVVVVLLLELVFLFIHEYPKTHINKLLLSKNSTSLDATPVHPLLNCHFCYFVE